MSDYAAMIRRTEAQIKNLHAAIHVTVKHRDASPSQHELWLRACDKFHAYRPPIAGLLEACEMQGIADFADLRAFAFAYVAVDPYYYRSGYTMERLLRQIKRLDVSEPEKASLRSTILTRIDRGARREFRHLCRTIPQIKTASF